jgi:hypothetical protein
MNSKRISLLKYRGDHSSLYTGRPQGLETRKELELDKNDNAKNQVTFIIPKGTTSFNPSFFLGLLFDSIRNLGIEDFDKYYNFEIEETEPSIIKVLKENLEDAKRNAKNALLYTSNTKRLLKG